MKKFTRVTLIELTYNSCNGLFIDLLSINDKCLFSINTDLNRFMIINLFFIELTIWDKTS